MSVTVLISVIGGVPASPPAGALVGDITAFRDPTGEHPVGFNSITAGADGNIWFSTTSANSPGQPLCDPDGVDRDSLGRITPSGEMTFFTHPELDCPDSLTLGPDGNVWFTASAASGGGGPGFIAPNGDITFVSIAAYAYAVGPDGNLWYLGSTGQGSHRLVRTDTSGQTLADFPALSLDGELVVGADGNFWYRTRTGCNGQPSLVRQTPTGVITTVCDPSGNLVPDDPRFGWGAHAAGPDGTIWFTVWDGMGGNGVASIDTLDPDPAATMQLVADLPTRANSIVQGTDGNMWAISAILRRVSPAGVVSTFRVESGDLGYLRDLAVGPDGNLWFAAFGNTGQDVPGGVGRVSMGAPECNTAPPPAPLVDVPEGAWYGDAVDWGACHGFLRTIGGDRFAPKKAMKRGQLVQTLWEMVDRPGATAGSRSPNPHGFTDVDADDWFNDALDWAAGREMFTMLPGGEFRQHRELRRGEFAYVLWRMAGSPPASRPCGFVDVPPSAWYAPAVDWAAEHGLNVTASTTRLHPKKTVKRAQALAAIYRLASDPTAWTSWGDGPVSTWRFE